MVWAQGHPDTSHGCLNLNADNANGFDNFSTPGDVVEIRNTADRRWTWRRTVLDAQSGPMARRGSPKPSS